MNEMMQQVVGIALKAGKAIMDIYAAPVGDVMTKADDSPLTQADIASDRIISVELGRMELGWPILSEESAQIKYGDRKDWQCFWLIDPLDGTKEFIKHNDEFTVNIALIENGEPVLGVVYGPALDVCYFAARGVGAFVRRNKEAAIPIAVKPYKSGELLRVVTSRSHIDLRTELFLNRLHNYQCVSMGSSLKLCLIAEGLAHLYPRLGPTMEWDTAAAHAVVKYAGGRVCDLSGAELRYNKSDLHNQEFLVLPRVDEQWLSLFNEK